jgi:hypothetical protein
MKISYDKFMTGNGRTLAPTENSHPYQEKSHRFKEALVPPRSPATPKSSGKSQRFVERSSRKLCPRASTLASNSRRQE